MHSGFMFVAMQVPKRVFLTGATGFVGTHTLFHLLHQGYEVTAIRRNSKVLPVQELVFELLNQRHGCSIGLGQANWVLGDILDHNALTKMSAGADAFIHTAAKVSFHHTDRDTMSSANIHGTANVVNACLANGISRLIHLSSVAALPNPDKKKELDERFLNSTFYRFESSYGESKYRGEMEVWRGQGEGLDVSVFNPGIIIGEWKFSLSSVEMFKAVANGMPFYSSGMTGLVDINDVAQALTTSLLKPQSIGKRYILVGDNLKYRDLLWQIADDLGRPRPRIMVGRGASVAVAALATFWASLTGGKAFISLEMAKAASRVTYFSHERAIKDLDMSFSPLAAAIQRTARFYLDHPSLAVNEV
ncbi:MAG: NAD-dependent epimerase/dehydratase family protein [Bacteroidetes bacterium]|jgi:nucleoside-diphosphate-sugar epimerase|nr:NAD-dependent epimerase/dehydratase family protein [Bacteroidota bacterium]